MERIRNATKEAKSIIQKAQEDMTRYYNQQRTLVHIFKPRDKVFLDISNIQTI